MVGVKKLTKRQKQAIDTKLKILKISFELFKEKGFEAVKVKEICEASDISVGAFYHHFESKDKIIDTGYKQIDSLVIEKYQLVNYDNYKDKIQALLGDSGDLLEELGWQFIAEVYKNLISVNNKYSFSVDRYIYKEILLATEMAIKNGELNEAVSPSDLSNTLLRLSRGAIFDWCLNKGSYNLKDRIHMDLDLVFNMYCKIN